MYITDLILKNFRNYNALHLHFDNTITIIHGDNGQGKTNILEAIYLCASGRSHRTSRDMEMVNMNADYFSVELQLQKQYMEHFLHISYEKGQKKKISINKIPSKKLGDLMGIFNAVMFSPEDLLIIKEGPSERRRFIDIALSQLRPAYFFDLQQYMKVLQQKNNLLKELQKNKKLIDTLDIWNMSLARTGARIIKARNDFVMELQGKVESNHKRLTNTSKKMLLQYTPSVPVSGTNVEDIENRFRKEIEKNISREIAKGSAVVGPQRDDYDIFLGDMNIRQFGSQGQQRTAVLALKLSEIDIMKDYTGEYPVLLLDDVMSELDIHRQEFLIENMKEIQTFITCTSADIFRTRFSKHSHFIEIKQGSIVNNDV